MAEIEASTVCMLYFSGHKPHEGTCKQQTQPYIVTENVVNNRLFETFNFRNQTNADKTIKQGIDQLA